MDEQLDLICQTCPLTDCDEGSLWCLFRLLTNPNPAQLAIVRSVPQIRQRKKRFDFKTWYRENLERERERNRKDYLKNRDKKIAAAKKRYRAKKENDGLLS